MSEPIITSHDVLRTRDAKMLIKAASESPEFGRYAEYILSECPGAISMPMLRELYKHNATAIEYRAHMDRIKREAIAPRRTKP